MISNQLTVIGSRRQVQLFEKSDWAKMVNVRYYEWLETSPGRFMCQFTTDSSPLNPLKELSERCVAGLFQQNKGINESAIAGRQ